MHYPQYEHFAVIVAEDITRSIPLIAVHMRALDVGGTLTSSATTVLDLVRLGTDEEDEAGQSTDRQYWIGRSSKSSVELACPASRNPQGLAR